MAVNVKDIQTLRANTGAGFSDCKKALEATDGDLKKAAEYLREQGIANASRKAGRVAAEGVVDSYIHLGGKIGVLVEVNCETDFAAKSDKFKALAHNIAIHIAATNPLFLNKSEVTEDFLENEKKILRTQAINEGKPAAVVEKMVEGRVQKLYKEVCLLEQEYVKDPSKTIDQLVKEHIAIIGENISIRRFARFELGEGIEKRNENLADEVAKQVESLRNKN